MVRGVHYERHLVFAITSDSLHETISSFPRMEITCFRCGERGHKKGECRTYRTKMCRHPKDCKDPNCSFAHSAAQLRTPWVARCIRVIRVDGQLRRIGCGETGHTFRECPHGARVEGGSGPSFLPPESVAEAGGGGASRGEAPMTVMKTSKEWDAIEGILAAEEKEAEDKEAPSAIVEAITRTPSGAEMDEVERRLALPGPGGQAAAPSRAKDGGGLGGR